MMKRLLLFLLLTSCAVYARPKHALRQPLVFRPSHESLLQQNEEIDRLNLQRFKDDKELNAAIESGALVRIPETKALRVSSALPLNRRYCRPWTLDFLSDFSYAYWLQFNKPLQVNSAVRTVYVQQRLRRLNRNAAPAHGETESSHIAGLTVDIARRGLTKEQGRWIETYLLTLGDVVIVEKEIRQPCYHICVKGTYNGNARY